MIQDWGTGSSKMVQNTAEVFLHIDDWAVKMLVKIPIINYKKNRTQKKNSSNYSYTSESKLT